MGCILQRKRNYKMAEFEYLTTNRNEEEKDMGKFYDVAKGIFTRLHDSEIGISADEVPILVESIMGPEINCYPGSPYSRCHEFCLFVSLTSPAHAKGARHLKFRKALETIVQHVEDTCIDTEEIAFVTDSWDAKAFNEWKGILERISHKIHFEIYLIAGHTISQIKI